MKNKLEQELKQKEFENEINRDLNLENSKQEYHERFHAGYSTFEITAIYFFGTLIVSYFIYFVAGYIFKMLFGTAIGFLGIDPTLITIPIHAAIFIIATISAVKKRSILDDIFSRY